MQASRRRRRGKGSAAQAALRRLGAGGAAQTAEFRVQSLFEPTKQQTDSAAPRMAAARVAAPSDAAPGDAAR